MKKTERNLAKRSVFSTHNEKPSRFASIGNDKVTCYGKFACTTPNIFSKLLQNVAYVNDDFRNLSKLLEQSQCFFEYERVRLKIHFQGGEMKL